MDELSPDQIQLNRRMKMAEVLRQQSMQQDPQQTAGGYVIPFNPLQGAAKLLNAYSANKIESETDTQRKQMEQERSRKIADALKNYGKVNEVSSEMNDMSGGIPSQGMYNYQTQTRDANPQEQMQQDYQLSQLDPAFAKVIESRNTREDTQQARLDQIRLQKELAAMQLKAGQNPYYQFLPTATGYVAANARSGQAEGLFGKDGKPIIPAQFDVPLQGALAGSKAQGSETGKGMGESVVKLAEIESMMPRLGALTQELSALGKNATYTIAGQAADSARRQAGLPVGESAIARKEYISKVDNEVMPLLRQTFGAAFTEREGASLRATLGDPDVSPAEKDAVLKSFIESKLGQIQSLQRRTGASQTAPAMQAPSDIHSQADAILRGGK